MSDLSAYRDYRESSIPWIATIPAHWEDVRARFVARLETGHTPDRDESSYWDGDIPWFSLSDMSRVRESGSRYVSETNEYITKKGLNNASTRLVPSGTVILSRTATIGFTCILKVEAATDQSMVNWVCGDELIPEFLYYVFESMGEEFDRLAEGSTHKSIYMPDVRSIKIPLPPVEEQSKIVKFLNNQLDIISTLLNKFDKIREAAERKKNSIVSGAVTHGLGNSNTTDSGVGWIGQVNSDWDVISTKFVAQLESGHTPDRSKDEYWENTNIPWLTTSDIKKFRGNKKRYLHETENQISELGMENSGAHLLPEGTVFLSRTASVGFSGIMGKPMATSQDFANWVCGDEIIPEYLLYVFRSMEQEFERLMQGSTHQTIYMPDIKSFKTPLPPVEEQREIVEHVETETERLWELIDRVDETIDLLEEKRQALITAAVTGQIDVSEEKGVIQGDD
ncbi:restriction endonuclease subunit S [Halorubrum salipaludis]|uniref:Restriction endonuclease subunit S n=1 Tax=Halorubrum salipaludis TaxID=2032630 RepID=A0A2A2FCG9_9EURY|nr:restriction endonuclease subunit S [Halorubrum salipaludis]PAU83181.1 restriction endonuclease subunit S [Halorubrum salipaludis]